MHYKKWGFLVVATALLPCSLSVLCALGVVRWLGRKLGRKTSHAQATQTGNASLLDAKVAVVITAFNVADLLQLSLSKILEEERNVEIYVCDGGSTDNTREVVLLHAANDKRVHLVYHPKVSGRAACLNGGACAASEGDAPIFLFLHGDTRPDKGFCDKARELLHTATNTSVGAFLCYTDAVDNLATRWFCIFGDYTTNLRSKYLELPYGDQTYFMKRETFYKLKGFPACPLMEDVAFIWAARALGDINIVDLRMSTFAGSFNYLGPFFLAQNYLFVVLWLLLGCHNFLFHIYYPDRSLPAASHLTYEQIKQVIMKQ